MTGDRNRLFGIKLAVSRQRKSCIHGEINAAFLLIDN